MPLWFLLNTTIGGPGGSFADRLGAHISERLAGRRRSRWRSEGRRLLDFAAGAEALELGAQASWGWAFPNGPSELTSVLKPSNKEIDDRIAGESATCCGVKPGWVRLGWVLIFPDRLFLVLTGLRRWGGGA